MYRAILLALLVAVAYADQDATTYCFSVANRRNQKDLYADLSDCHRYYQCFYINETFAVGFRRNCAVGTFWHDSVLTCMPEGTTPCSDRCMDEATASKGCYAGTGCRQFFVCANTGSYGMCCPLGSQFNEATCTCDQSDTCKDSCTMPAPAIPTSVAPPKQVNATVCMDPYGSYISAVAGESNAYSLVDVEGHPTEKRYCQTGMIFSMASCRCEEQEGYTMPPYVPLRRATMWVPFDADLKDWSINHFSLFSYNGAQLDTTTYAYGGASLNVNGGWISIPGLKGIDHRNQYSWAGFFNCDGTCTGSILSNNKDTQSSEFTVIIGLTAADTFTVRLHYYVPTGAKAWNVKFNPKGWNYFAVTYDGNNVVIKVNDVIVKDNVAGYLAASSAPYAFGNDQVMGTFKGHVDNLLVAPFALTEAEIKAHSTGDNAYLHGLGFF